MYWTAQVWYACMLTKRTAWTVVTRPCGEGRKLRHTDRLNFDRLRGKRGRGFWFFRDFGVGEEGSQSALQRLQTGTPPQGGSALPQVQPAHHQKHTLHRRYVRVKGSPHTKTVSPAPLLKVVVKKGGRCVRVRHSFESYKMLLGPSEG